MFMVLQYICLVYIYMLQRHASLGVHIQTIDELTESNIIITMDKGLGKFVDKIRRREGGGWEVEGKGGIGQKGGMKMAGTGYFSRRDFF